jgi:hypothetical protein
MALIACSECGRAVSNKAIVCIGCGAPLPTNSPIDLVPRPSKAPPPSRDQIKRRVAMSFSVFVAGVIWASLLGPSSQNRIASLAAALLIVVGLCWLIVSLIHAMGARQQ